VAVTVDSTPEIFPAGTVEQAGNIKEKKRRMIAKRKGLKIKSLSHM
jgi:hypothetical protein